MFIKNYIEIILKSRKLSKTYSFNLTSNWTSFNIVFSSFLHIISEFKNFSSPIVVFIFNNKNNLNFLDLFYIQCYSRYSKLKITL